MNKKTIFVLIIISLLSLFLNTFKKKDAPPSFNADEAAFGYNAYSIAETGKDEYGTPLPVRLKSFGDYKMPLYSYLSVPFVKVFGLSENSVRLLNTLLAFLMPFAMFALVKEFFDDDKKALLAALLVDLSWGLLSISRQAHEAYLSVFLTILTLLFFVRLSKKITNSNTALFLISILLMLFSYQSSRIFVGVFFVITIFYFLKKKGGKQLVTSLILIILLFGITDIVYRPKRLGNLFFTNTPGFTMKINELRYEGGSRVIYNKLSVGKKEFINSYAKYFSPQFLFIEGDENPRFGFVDMGPITAFEYLFLFIGIYFLFKKKEKYRNLLLIFLFISPVSGALSWAGTSLTRSLFFFIPILTLVSYGVIELYRVVPKKYSLLFLFAVVAIQGSLLFYTWDFYFNHFPKRATVIRGWQSGYRDLASFVKDNYENYDRFYITKKNGQPYIFLLFYLKYPPEKYQRQAQLSSPDEYGFGQVEQFDKFIFSTNADKNARKSVLIGYPEDFAGMNVNESKIKKIKKGTEEIFWIYETI